MAGKRPRAYLAVVVITLMGGVAAAFILGALIYSGLTP
jgi:hypothetical protein